MKLKPSHPPWMSEVGFVSVFMSVQGMMTLAYLPESGEHSVMSFVIDTQGHFITLIRKKKSWRIVCS